MINVAMMLCMDEHIYAWIHMYDPMDPVMEEIKDEFVEKRFNNKGWP